MNNFCKRCICNKACNKKKEFKHTIKKMKKIIGGEIYRSDCDGTILYEGKICDATIKCNAYIDKYGNNDTSATDGLIYSNTDCTVG